MFKKGIRKRLFYRSMGISIGHDTYHRQMSRITVNFLKYEMWLEFHWARK